MMDELYCGDCMARFRNDCHCSPQLPISEKKETWRGANGHLYIGDSKRASLALHNTEECGCPMSSNFDPDSWY